MEKLFTAILEKVKTTKINLVKPLTKSVVFWVEGRKYEIFPTDDGTDNIDLLLEGLYLITFANVGDVQNNLEKYIIAGEYCKRCGIVEPIHNDDFVLCPICGANLT